jgi:hypothetical protein
MKKFTQAYLFCSNDRHHNQMKDGTDSKKSESDGSDDSGDEGDKVRIDSFNVWWRIVFILVSGECEEKLASGDR